MAHALTTHEKALTESFSSASTTQTVAKLHIKHLLGVHTAVLPRSRVSPEGT